MPAPANAKAQSTVGRVALYYERRATSDRWGDLARDEAFSPTFAPSFYEKLDNCLRALWLILGIPHGIVSGGAYVDKPGAHGLARGFDLDGIIWSQENWKWSALDWKNSLADRVFYLGLQAHFLLTFGNVLGYLYNAAHHDHFHIDDLVAARFRSSSHSLVTFVQESLHVVHRTPLVKVDGDWGPKTSEAFFGVLLVPNNRPFPTEDEWKRYLGLTRSVGLATRMKAIPEGSPSNLTSALAMSPAPTRPLSLEDRLARLEAQAGDHERRITQLEL